MRVNIDEIKDAGLRKSWDVPREAVDEIVQGDRAGYRASAPVHVDATLEKVERRAILTQLDQGFSQLLARFSCLGNR